MIEPVEEAVVRGDESIKAPPLKAEADVRIWHDSSGEFHTEAQFVSMTAGVVTLLKTDGTTVKVPLERLSEEDRKWIEARRKKRRP